MPRTGRAAAGGILYHVLNRGNGRSHLFHNEADYDAFVRLLGEVREAVVHRPWARAPGASGWASGTRPAAAAALSLA